MNEEKKPREIIYDRDMGVGEKFIVTKMEITKYLEKIYLINEEDWNKNHIMRRVDLE